jgi:hypothetical protein
MPIAICLHDTGMHKQRFSELSPSIKTIRSDEWHLVLFEAAEIDTRRRNTHESTHDPHIFVELTKGIYCLRCIYPF